MFRKLRLLVVDNDSSYLQFLRALLASGDFIFDVALDPKHALQQLSSTFYHAVLLQDALGIEVLETLDQDKTLALEKYASISRFFVREYQYSLDTIHDKYRKYRYNNMISGEFAKGPINSKYFINSISRAIDSNLKILIEYPENVTVSNIVKQLVPDNFIQSSNHLNLLAEELDFLLCRLLSDYDQVTLKLITPGYSGAGVLVVSGTIEGTKAELRLIKIGEYKALNKENQHFQKFVQHFLRRGMMSNILKFVPTTHFGGILYTFLGNETGEALHEFGAQYREMDSQMTTTIITQIINVICQNWYSDRVRPTSERDLIQHYREILKLDLDNLNNAVRLLSGISMLGNQIKFNRLTNPLTMTSPFSVLEYSYMTQFAICPTHGDLNERNILVNNFGIAWLIDFEHTDRSHVMRDIACMDTTIRISLLSATDADLDARHTLESALLQIENFNDLERLTLPNGLSDTALAKTFDLVLSLRKMARQKIVSDKSDRGLGEYYVALLCFALRTIKFAASLGEIHREHALLSASLLAQQLGLTI